MVPQGLAPGNDPLPQSVAIHAPHCRGVVAGTFADALRPLFDALPSTGSMQEVKRSTVRTVLRGEIGGVDVHLKLYRSVTLSDRARDAFRGDRGTHEAKNLIRAAHLDLPVAQPIACGSLVDAETGSRSFLVTRTIQGARPFAFDMSEETLVHTGRLLRRMHDRGFLPGDLHCGNVVTDERGLPWLLDLNSVRHGGEPDLARRAAALAYFCQPLDGGPLDLQAQPLLLAYLAAGRDLPREFATELAKAARLVRHRALSSFHRRWSRDCRHTSMPKKRRGEFRWHLHLVADAADRAPLHDACRAFAASPGAPDKTGRRGSVWLLPDIAAKQRGQGDARSIFQAMYWLLFAGVGQPEPVALATKHDLAYVFARRVPSPSIADELAAGSLRGDELVEAARSFGRSVGRLHAHGLRNRDMKFENLLREPVTGAVLMADLDGVRRKDCDDTRGQGMDLGRVLAAFHAAGRPGGSAVVFAFVRAYLRARQRLLQPAETQKIWKTAEKRAREWASAHPDAGAAMR